MRRIVIQAWNQPDGRGYGWAKCNDRKAEKFFVFIKDKEGRQMPTREFKTRADAKSYAKSIEKV
jgi:hypothetical protein